jgi:p-aminobenzoyl-glutamate transporter AbgT
MAVAETIVLIISIMFYAGFAIYGYAVNHFVKTDKIHCFTMTKNEANLIRMSLVVGILLTFILPALIIIKKANLSKLTNTTVWKSPVTTLVLVMWLFALSTFIACGALMFKLKDDDKNNEWCAKISETSVNFLKFGYYFNMVLLSFLLFITIWLY